VIAANDENLSAGVGETPHLGAKENRGLDATLAAIEQIAGDQQRIDRLVEAKIDNSLQGLTRGVADDLCKLDIPKCQGFKR
jgi:hypothetical protein